MNVFVIKRKEDDKYYKGNNKWGYNKRFFTHEELEGKFKYLSEYTEYKLVVKIYYIEQESGVEFNEKPTMKDFYSKFKRNQKLTKIIKKI